MSRTCSLGDHQWIASSSTFSYPCASTCLFWLTESTESFVPKIRHSPPAVLRKIFMWVVRWELSPHPLWIPSLRHQRWATENHPDILLCVLCDVEPLSMNIQQGTHPPLGMVERECDWRRKVWHNGNKQELSKDCWFLQGLHAFWANGFFSWGSSKVLSCAASVFPPPCTLTPARFMSVLSLNPERELELYLGSCWWL